MNTASGACPDRRRLSRRYRRPLLVVPYRFARVEVEARLTASGVEIFHKGERIAVHLRASGNRKHTTVPEHMPSGHRRYAGWTIERIREDARRIGPAPAALCEQILESRPHPEDAVRDMEEDEAMTRQALDLLNSRRKDPYEAATTALREDTQQWWADTLARDPAELEEDEEPATADAEGLRRFLEGEVLPWFEARKKELANRPLIREQAFGESLDPDKLERLGRYEVHLDRKLERTLAMLLRLKDLRQGAIAG